MCTLTSPFLLIRRPIDRRFFCDIVLAFLNLSEWWIMSTTGPLGFEEDEANAETDIEFGENDTLFCLLHLTWSSSHFLNLHVNRGFCILDPRVSFLISKKAGFFWSYKNAMWTLNEYLQITN